MELFPLEEGSFHNREHGFRIRIPARKPHPGCASKLDLSLMPTEFPNDGTIDELLRLAGLSTERSAARRWLESALAAARGTPERRLVRQPSPARHNAPLDKIERASDRLIAALKQLKSHPHAYASFWRFAAFGPVYVSEFERAGVIPTLTNICDAARKARVRRTGRPRNYPLSVLRLAVSHHRGGQRPFKGTAASGGQSREPGHRQASSLPCRSRSDPRCHPQ